MKLKLKDFIPPIVFKVLRQHPRSSMREYDSYDSALKDSNTYEDPGIIEVVARKTKAYRDSLISNTGNMINNRQTVQNMFVVSYVYRDLPIDVLELGGACGASYFELSHLLPGRISRWFVVETPAMATAGRRLFQDGKIKFFDNLRAAASEIGSPDLTIAQGVLQCTSNPLQTLDDLLEHASKYVYVTRTIVGLGIERPIITKQVSNISEHGPGAFPKGLTDRKTTQPLTIVPYESIASHISVGYRIIFSFDEGKPRPLLLRRSIMAGVIGFLTKALI